MIPALDPDPESDFQLVGDPYPDLNPVKSRIVIPSEAFGFWSLNQEFSLFGNFGSGFGSSKKWNCNTSFVMFCFGNCASP